ncbi:MAG: preprotein translocase subunit SecG [Gammaproteobacteria bacterium]|nr:preprotein translocase subunit SecG [Gammaproteobacteria bacterium]
MFTVLQVFLVVLAVALSVLVLIQRGKGADIGAAFGSGASNTVFGSQGSASFLTRATAVVATLFFITCLGLAYLTGKRVEVNKSVVDMGAPVQSVPAAPTAPADVPVLPANK